MRRGRGVATIIVGAMPKPEEGKEEGSSESEKEEEVSEYDMMAEEILDAIKSEDPKMLAESLKGYIETCLADHDVTGPEEEESEDSSGAKMEY